MTAPEPPQQPGESHGDALARLDGERIAAEHDRDTAQRARTRLVEALRELHGRYYAHTDDGDVHDACVECSRESRGLYVPFPCNTRRTITEQIGTP